MTSRLTPKEVFDDPGDLSFLKSERFERQYFERKETPTIEHCRKEKPAKDPNGVLKQKLGELRDKIQSTLGSFAVSNPDPNGGLFALGIDDEGVINGLKHLDTEQIALLIDVNSMLENVHCQVKRVNCTDANGESNFIYLLYVSFVPEAIVCGANSPHKVWHRIDSYTKELDKDRVDQLRIDRGILPFESQHFGEFSEDELDQDLAQRFCSAIIENQQLPLTTAIEDILFRTGVIDRRAGKYYWTKAGYLFLSVNPRRRFPGAYIRVVKIEGRQTLAGIRFNPSFDQDFDGPLPRQITKVRVFLRQSAFFKTFEYRNGEGSLIQEHELPPAAWEEAIVNAVVHRSYALETIPVRVIKYADKLIVESPGSFARLMPHSKFSVTEIPTGQSRPRNPKLMEWLRLMTDERDERYVKAWQEGTRTIAETMRNAQKPEPVYETNGTVSLTLENDIDALEARIAAAQLPAKDRFANFFPLLILKGGVIHAPLHEESHEYQSSIASALRDALRNSNWFIDNDRHGELIAFRRNSQFAIKEIEKYVRLYPAYRFHVRRYGDGLFLCLDYAVRTKGVLLLQEIMRDLDGKTLIGNRAIYRQSGKWQLSIGIIRHIAEEYSTLYLFNDRQTVQVPNSDILPDLTLDQISQVLRKHGVSFDLTKEIKQRALSMTQGSSRERAERTIQTVAVIAEEIFPLDIPGARVSLQKNAAALEMPTFDVRQNLEEPQVEFRDQHQSSNIADGLTRYGSFRKADEVVHLVLVCTREVQDKMENLVKIIQKGSRKYRGAGMTFGTGFEVSRRIVVRRPEGYLDECKSIVSELHDGKKWLFLVYAPENAYSRSNYSSPYYQVKRFLLETGFPSQMVKEDTIENPDWKDLNLALNIIAKCGYEPWVLTKPLAEADCFIGLSYSTLRTAKGIKRFVGYANVFNKFGQWKFYKGSTVDCSYEERDTYAAELVRQTIVEFEKTVSVQNVHLHSSERFSQSMREAVVKAARIARPDVAVHFVHINTTHPVRMYDNNPQGDGSLPRGTYVITSPHQLYLSTTGYNLVQKSLGTPVMLEVNAITDYLDRSISPNLECIAQHLLSLTKLNWASTRYFCHEPITTKYAGDIAYLMNAFLASGTRGEFALDPVLEKTPWFL